MAVRFETDKDLTREEAAIKLLCDKGNAKYYKLDENDVDFRVESEQKTYYVEVKGRNRNEQECYPLPLAARKMVKLCDKQAPAVIVWDCLDAIIYGNVKEIQSIAKYGGRKPRQGSCNDEEYMLYFNKQEGLKTIFK